MDSIEQTTQPLTRTSGAPATQQKYTGPPKWRSSRFLLAYIILAGNAVIFFQRVSFSMAIVCMVNHTALDIQHRQGQLLQQQQLQDTGQGSGGGGGGGVSSPAVFFNETWTKGAESGTNLTGGWVYRVATTAIPTGPDGSTAPWGSGFDSGASDRGGSCSRQGDGNHTGSRESEDGPFLWTKETQGILLGAVYWGYMATQIIGGYLFFVFGPRKVAAVSMLLMALLVVLCHAAALWSPWAVFVLRVAIGVCTSFTMPSMFAIWGQWAPKGERATLLSLSFSGQNVANSAVFPTAALLCKYGFAGGWPSVFYVYGLLGVVWCGVWMVVVSDSPESSRWIHPDERDYIVAQRGQVAENNSKTRVPWCSIFSSTAFWALLAGHVTFTWGLFLFMSNLPLYMYEVMNFDIKSNGFYSMLPYLALFLVQLTGGFFADFLVRRQIMTVFWVRRFVTVLASLIPAVSLVVMSYLDCTHVAGVLCLLVISMGFMGFAFSGFLVNAYDIAPRYAVSITSVTNSAACIPGIVTPYLVAEVTYDQTREQWQIIFFITAGVYVCGTLFFCIFARTSLQPWAHTPSHTLQIKPLHPANDKDGCTPLEDPGYPEKPGCHPPENCHLEKPGCRQRIENGHSPGDGLHSEKSALTDSCHCDSEKCLSQQKRLGAENGSHLGQCGCIHPEKAGWEQQPETREQERLIDGGSCEDSHALDSARNTTSELSAV